MVDPHEQRMIKLRELADQIRSQPPEQRLAQLEEEVHFFSSVQRLDSRNSVQIKSNNWADEDSSE